MVDPYYQTSLCSQREDTGILIPHDERLLEGDHFDKMSTSITRTNVDSLFLSLAATGILEIQNSPDGIWWVLGRQAPTTATTDTDVSLISITFGMAMYTLDNYWVGTNLHPATRIRVRTLAIPTP